MSRLIIATPHPKLPHYLSALRWPFNRALGDVLKGIPSVRYAPELGSGYWIGAVDALQTIAEEASTLGWTVQADPALDTRTHTGRIVTGIGPSLHGYQRAGAERAIGAGAHMLAFDPGLGKTASALAAVQAAGCTRALVICPAIARRVWEDQAVRTWRTHETDRVCVVTTGKEAAGVVETASLVVCSYELAPKLPPFEWDAVILDESHYCKSGTSQRSKAVRKLIDACSPRLLITLTGTPIMNAPIDLWAQLDMMHPGRWGSMWQFQKRYANAVENEYAQSGYTYEGLNPDHAEELRDRLARVCSRVTVDEVRHLLPPLTVSPLWIDVKAPPARRALTESTARKAAAHRAHEAAVSTAALKALDGRLDHAVKWAVDATECGPAVVFVYRRGSAHELRKRLQAAGVAAWAVTGELAHEARHAAVAEWSAVPAGVLVATIDSMGVAIDLTHARLVLVGELHFQPGAVVQALRRCYRLSSKAAVTITILAIRGTYDDVIVRALEEKLGNIEALQDVATVDRDVAQALRGPEESEEAWTRRLREAAAQAEWDPYR